jgi:aryl-alcohol dehydrogenase-like predicted oxidoreductase
LLVEFSEIAKMQYRELGRTGWKVSAISFGAWAIGGAWGDVDDEQSLMALRAAVESGVNFIDTADVYGDGRSERLVAKLRKELKQPIIVATKAGRRLEKQTVEGYSRKNLTEWIDRSLLNLNIPTIDLLQLHCPPTDLFYRPEVFGILDDLVRAGKMRFYGVSVERIEEAIKAIEFPNVQTVQIIFNMFRQRPAEVFFDLAQKRKVGILARVPLASGMLTGKLTRQSTFAADDHRQFNRHGEQFDRGETFGGVDYDTALVAVEELKAITPKGMTMGQFALRWILMFDEVTCAIPGAKTAEQARANAGAADMPAIDAATMQRVKAIYDRSIRELVHQYW